MFCSIVVKLSKQNITYKFFHFLVFTILRYTVGISRSLICSSLLKIYIFFAMKFIIKTFFYSYLVSNFVLTLANETSIYSLAERVASSTEFVGEALYFCKKIYEVSEENSRWNKKLNGLVNYMVYKDRDEVKTIFSELTETLKSATDSFDTTIRNIKGMCTFNINTNEHYQQYLNSTVVSSDFKVDFSKRLSFLNDMLVKSLSETIKAEEIIVGINRNITKISSRRYGILEKLNNWADGKKAEFEYQIHEIDVAMDSRLKRIGSFFKVLLRIDKDSYLHFSAETLQRYKRGFESRIRFASIFSEDAMAYIHWFGETGFNLKKMAHQKRLDIVDIKAVVESQKTLINESDKFLLDIDDLEKEEKDSILDEIHTAVKFISEKSESFVKKIK